jgi:hypothetical protein
VVDDESGRPLPGAVVTARPEDRSAGEDRFPGFSWSPGWGGYAGADGTILLRALPPGEPHRIAARAEGRAEVRRDGVLPGSAAHPEEVVLRLRRN